MKKKILLIGANSKINMNFEKKFSYKYDIYLTTKFPKKKNHFWLDLKDEIKLSKDNRFDAAIMCAGLTNQQYCHENYTEAFKINVTAQTNLIDFLGKDGCKIIFPSTNLVFSENKMYRTEASKKNPHNTYGFFKSIVEEYLINSNYNYNIIRLSKVILKDDNLFLNWLKLLKKEKQIFAFTNHYISPISMDFNIYKIEQTIQNKIKEQIIHLSAFDIISYYDCIKYLSIKFGYRSELIQPALASKEIKIKNPKLDCKVLEANNLRVPSSYEALNIIENPHQ